MSSGSVSACEMQAAELRPRQVLPAPTRALSTSAVHAAMADAANMRPNGNGGPLCDPPPIFACLVARRR